MTAPTTPAGDKPLPTGWRGPVLPLNTPSGDMRQFMLADGAEPAIRPLPVALSAQDEMWDNHDGSRVVGLVTRAWVQDGHLWAEGPLDLEDEFGAAYARKLGNGFAGWVSADLSDISLEEIPLRSDKSEWEPNELAAAYAAFDEGTGDEPDVAGQLLRVHEWKLMGVTGVSSPAFETSRIEPVYGEEFGFGTSSAVEALAASAAKHSGAMIALVPSAEDCARLAIDDYEPADVLHTTLVFLGDAANWSPEQRDALEQSVRVLDFTSPLSGTVMGHAQFNPAGDEPCAVYLVEARGLSATQSCTYGAVADNVDLPPIPEPYDTFLPHITAGYGLDVSKLAEVGPIRFDRIRLSFADTDVRDIPLEPVTAGLVASSVVYDTADFTMPEPDELTALTVTDDGRVYGHLAQADSCHIGFADVCVSPPTSATGYAYFHQGEISTTDGPLPVGKLTLGTGHAGMRQAACAAAEHYDNTGTAVAVVRCTDGLWGPWLSGRILPGIDDARIDELRRSGVSGDWRSIQRGSNKLELVAVLAVNVPGFPVPRTRALAASGMRSLIAAGIPPTRKRHDRPTETKKSIDITQVRATALRKSRSQTAAQRVRSARLAAATRRVERLGKERRVRTPDGERRYGQPIESVIRGRGRLPSAPGNGGSSDPGGGDAEHAPEAVERQRVLPEGIVIDDVTPGGRPSDRNRKTPDELRSLGLVAPDDDKDMHFSDEERAAADWLRNQGIDVTSVSTADGKFGKVADALFITDDVTVEIKTVSKNDDNNSNAIEKAIRRGTDQSDRIFIDASESGLSREVLEKAVRSSVRMRGVNLQEICIRGGPDNSGSGTGSVVVSWSL
ncbi:MULTISPECIES: hypothetical protein [unclassified Rhodococcus (in: high G+C Gram-positive bacteria)]|uniref:hypothetical protein n=1 Tax=unclassified Rhodococcus (in: high G+C Gram-positive bacteria) TaxID=192944 RepID=UPI000A9C2A59|nr:MULTISPECIES: hypothetical protein [unclassified Rhodococcus (in: high G+C Gram-positive bacteria)]